MSKLRLQRSFTSLRELKDGWFSGCGVAPQADAIDWLEDCFRRYYPIGLDEPFVFTLPNGIMVADWLIDRWAPSLDIDFVKKQGHWYAFSDPDNGYASVERVLDLSLASSWDWIAEQIRKFETREADER